MDTVKVYHNENFLNWSFKDMTTDEAQEQLKKEFFAPTTALVADVITTDLEDAFRLTNHINCPWWENAEVISHVEKARSTSVGDFVKMGCKVYVVASCGYELVRFNYPEV